MEYRPKRIRKTASKEKTIYKIYLEDFCKTLYAFLGNPVDFTSDSSFLFSIEPKSSSYLKLFGKEDGRLPLRLSNAICAKYAAIWWICDYVRYELVEDRKKLRKSDGDYIKKLGYRINILIRECGWKNPTAITGDSFEKWRRKQQKAPKTLNEYLDSANAMFNWMTGKGRIAQNPLVTVEKVQFEPVRIRRAFEDNELERLLKVAGESRIGYLAAVHTGLRRAELGAALWENVDLDANVPTLRLSGKFTKNKKAALIAIHPELAAELRSVKPAGAKPSDPVFTGKMLPRMSKMKADLKKAGVEFLKNGRRADFHALRHTLGTNLARANIAPRVAMEIMRHSDIRLTMNHYTDSSQLPVAEAIATLPTFGAAQTSPDSQIHPQTQDILIDEQSRSGTVSPNQEPLKVIHPERLCHDLARTDVVEHNGEIGSSGRIRRFLPLCLMRFKRSLPG